MPASHAGIVTAVLLMVLAFVCANSEAWGLVEAIFLLPFGGAAGILVSALLRQRRGRDILEIRDGILYIAKHATVLGRTQKIPITAIERVVVESESDNRGARNVLGGRWRLRIVRTGGRSTLVGDGLGLDASAMQWMKNWIITKAERELADGTKALLPRTGRSSK
jgi:hypothetical protein